MKKSQVSKHILVIVIVGMIFSIGFQAGRGNFIFGNSMGSQNNLPSDIDYSSVEQVYDNLRQQYDGKLDYNKLMDGLKQGLVSASGDPYTEYLNAEQSKEFEGSLNGSFEGIGAELSKENDLVIIVAPIANTPAAKAGLKPKDAIIKINDESANGYSVEKAKNKIRGPKDTVVKLTVIRDGKELTFSITRATINVPSVESEIVDNIGIIRIFRFGDDTTELAEKVARDFKSKNVKGVILDLRGNPGGYLTASVDVSSLWLNNKVVLKEKRDNKIVKTFKSDNNAILEGIPTVVLIDEGSASASEITAGALKDNSAAKLVGQKSFGKGSVQQPQELPSGGILKVTIARWYTPNDKNIDKQGIEPDHKVKITEDDIKNKKDPQLEFAKKLLNK